MNDLTESARSLFRDELPIENGVYIASNAGASENEVQTSAAFSEKWVTRAADGWEGQAAWERSQLEWYLRCYGFEDEQGFAEFLGNKRIILDAGCGPGYKAAWFARLKPDALVVAMDLSESIFVAAKAFADIRNLVFVRGDIAATPFRDGAFDLVSCDQVLHHTEDPPATVAEFRRILAPDGTLNTYVYARKALPRELLDEHFREYSKGLSTQQLWDLSDQLTRLGRTLSELEIEIEVPEIPALGIEGGKIDLQRFIYWNFIKCYWNPEHGFDESKMINFDWYAPSTAFRYSRDEFEDMLASSGFSTEFLHSEEACHSGRFSK